MKLDTSPLANAVHGCAKASRGIDPNRSMSNCETG